MKLSKIIKNFKDRLNRITMDDGHQNKQISQAMQAVYHFNNRLKVETAENQFLALFPQLITIKYLLDRDNSPNDDDDLQLHQALLDIFEECITQIQEFKRRQKEKRNNIAEQNNYEEENEQVEQDNQDEHNQDQLTSHEESVVQWGEFFSQKIQILEAIISKLNTSTKIIKALIFNLFNKIYKDYFIGSESVFEKYIVRESSITGISFFSPASTIKNQQYLRVELKDAMDNYIKTPVKSDEDSLAYTNLLEIISKGKSQTTYNPADPLCLHSLLTEFQLNIQTLHGQVKLMQGVADQLPKELELPNQVESPNFS